MKEWLKRKSTGVSRRFSVAFLAVLLAFSLGSYEFVTRARAATPTPAAAALDDNSVSALTALDHAMETVAARVTPAIVNVTVTSKRGADAQNLSQDQDSDDQGQQMTPFGPMFGFGQRMRPQQPQIEHGLGSGVIISPDGGHSRHHDRSPHRSREADRRRSVDRPRGHQDQRR